jgi:predicted N-acetyltransferase YhbS
MSGPAFRTATLSDVALMLDWAAAEGWNPGLDDAAAFHATDPEGFFVAETGGAPVAAISVVNHSDSFAFLGFYICRPDWRGKGIGFALWQHALAHAGDRTVGLDGVADQEANYARSGFVRVGASVRFEGQLIPETSPRARPVTDDDHEALAVLDAEANGVTRTSFLVGWISDTATRRSLVLETGNEVTGFATIRACRDGVKIGPIVAPSVSDALTLSRAALVQLRASRVVIDVPSTNTALTGALRAEGFTDTFATARMYRGAAPAMTQNLQAIATMEAG